MFYHRMRKYGRCSEKIAMIIRPALMRSCGARSHHHSLITQHWLKAAPRSYIYTLAERLRAGTMIKSVGASSLCPRLKLFSSGWHMHRLPFQDIGKTLIIGIGAFRCNTSMIKRIEPSSSVIPSAQNSWDILQFSASTPQCRHQRRCCT